MDSLTWIHADENLKELRVLQLITAADMQIDISGTAKLIDNTWSITLPEKVWAEMPIEKGHYVYAPGTEWGGPVTLIQHVTKNRAITIQGPTWRGLLHQRFIVPPTGQAYLSFADVDANQVIREVVGNQFGSLVTVSAATAGVNVSAQYRYQSIAIGLQETMRQYQLRLNVVFDNAIPAVVLSAQPTTNLADQIEISQDYGVNFSSEIGNVQLANHIIALGSGTLANRMVVQVYRVGNTYYQAQPAELPSSALRSVILDYPNAESRADLIKSAVENLSQYTDAQSITVDELLLDVSADLGDQIPVRDRLTGLVAKSEILNKILSIKDGRVAIDMQVGVLSIDSSGTDTEEE